MPVRRVLIALLLSVSLRPACATDTSEAEQFFHGLIDPLFHHLSDGTDVSYTYFKVTMMPDWYRHYWQYKSLKWNLTSEALTDADILNGVMWRGQMHMQASAVRTAGTSSDWAKPACWFAWQGGPDGQPSINTPSWGIENKGGIWKLTNLSSGISSSNYGPGITPLTEIDLAQVLALQNCKF